MHGAEKVVHLLLKKTVFISKENLKLKAECAVHDNILEVII